MTFTPDLDAYCRRLGIECPRAPTFDGLGRLLTAHVQSIPFENLDVLLGRGIDLAPEAIERKLVFARRGGYCFEQNTHLLHVLRALGYDAAPLSARVRLQRPREFVPARTHMAVMVQLDGRRWLCDVGVGGYSPSTPLDLDLDGAQATRHEPRRIVREGEWGPGDRRTPAARAFQQMLIAGEWQDVYEFTLEAMPEIDREVANWFTSTHPRSHFRELLMVARATTHGRLTLRNREFTERDGDRATTRVLADPDELLAVLATRFDLHFPAGTRFPCPGLAW
ncbi:MAG: arylamine N-acetyltransferase [Planctomycetes bacterium]|nr:arylamine N-acetyltransferase [Planctomycetota bacterium]